MKICATRFIHTQPVAFISHSLDYSGSTEHRSACSLLFNQVLVLGEEIVSQQLLLFMVIVAHYTLLYAGIYGACVPAEKTKGFLRHAAQHNIYTHTGGVCQQTRAMRRLSRCNNMHTLHIQSDWTRK
jgi:hypothetical protein